MLEFNIWNVGHSIFSCSQIVTEYINATFSLVNKVKMIGMPLYLVHRLYVKKTKTNNNNPLLTEEPDWFHNHPTLLTMK